MLTMEPNVGNELFTLDYSQYPNMINLMDNPNLLVKENSTQQMITLLVVKVTIHCITVVLMKNRSKMMMTVMYELTLTIVVVVCTYDVMHLVKK